MVYIQLQLFLPRILAYIYLYIVKQLNIQNWTLAQNRLIEQRHAYIVR